MDEDISSVSVRVQRNGVTDTLNIEMGEELEIPDSCTSIEIIRVEADIKETLH